MTYCLAIKVNDGLVFASDSRTNAGVDQLSTYSKMFTFGIEGERALVLLTAGNLATTQSVVSQMQRDIREQTESNLQTFQDIEEAAEYVGQISQSQQRKHVDAAAGNAVDTSATFIFGGQIGDGPPKIFMIYPEGNFIASTDETPYQLIGEAKYGKPVLDRIIRKKTGLKEAATCALVSMDSTMQSNATVGPPIEVLLYQRDALCLDKYVAFQADNRYLIELKQAWDSEIKEAFANLSGYDWEDEVPAEVD